MSGQNRSHAVMSQRIEPTDSLDDFPTQPWATRAGVDIMRQRGLPLDRSMVVGEPTCNRGYMVRPLRELFASVFASDIHDYGYGYAVHDFTLQTFNNAAYPAVDWLFFNPPFNQALLFAEVALKLARVGVAMFVRMQWLEGEKRHRRLFSRRPPAFIFQFSERVLLLKGRVVMAGTINPETGNPYSTATAYSWVVWAPGYEGDTRFVWIPPCRRRFERPEDYRLEAASC